MRPNRTKSRWPRAKTITSAGIAPGSALVCLSADNFDETSAFAPSNSSSLRYLPISISPSFIATCALTLVLQIRGQFQQEILYLKSRMGFVKLALRNGLPLVPVYVFGANDTFHTSSFLQSFRLAITGRFRQAELPCTKLSRTVALNAYAFLKCPQRVRI